MRIVAAFVAAAVLAAPAVIHAQDYPGKPIKIVVPYPPGGGTDRIGRVLGEKLQAKWGQPVIVENRAGAGGNTGTEYFSRTAPDGYTLLFAAQAQYVIVQSLYARLGFDPDAFVPITVVSTSPNVLVVNPGVPADSLAKLIAFAKSNPGKLNYASTGSGSSQHLAAELLKSMAGVEAVHVPYKGTAPALTDVVAGHVQMMFMEISNALAQAKAGKLRVLAVAGQNRNPVLPDVPTVGETLPDFVSMQWTGLAAPPGTPAVIAERLHMAVAEALQLPDVAQRLKELSLEPVGSPPVQTAVFWKQERERWGKIIRLTGAKAD